MIVFLKCWFTAICRLIEETVRLQGYGAIPYLMAINSLFWLILKNYLGIKKVKSKIEEKRKFYFSVSFAFMLLEKCNCEYFMALLALFLSKIYY